MRAMGLQGAVRGKKLRTTIPDRSAPCPEDRVNRWFRAPRPNVLWLSDFTYVSTWAGFVYVAFRSEEHTSELQSLMRISYTGLCLNKQTNHQYLTHLHPHTTTTPLTPP